SLPADSSRCLQSINSRRRSGVVALIVALIFAPLNVEKCLRIIRSNHQVSSLKKSNFNVQFHAEISVFEVQIGFVCSEPSFRFRRRQSFAANDSFKSRKSHSDFVSRCVAPERKANRSAAKFGSSAHRTHPS